MKQKYYGLLVALLCVFEVPCLLGQASPDPLLPTLLGKWEVLSYSEQGITVNKQEASPAQARKVYAHVRGQRAIRFYGYQAYEEGLSRREDRAFKEWLERDSVLEVKRLMEVISIPYYAVFFADSTLSLYNKTVETGAVLIPESRRFALNGKTMSLDIFRLGGYERLDVQILWLDEKKLTLFIPDEAEVVELVKVPFALP
jgi:hypothetical protein